ncbi:MAG: MOSC domain-containing protein [Proteobacteria bacterium]|nr:MAG: MOSC domain-containing protein [Pseudomonadota bacterium]TDJ70877.1 MAG: MOSC domain-containing protein [Pseudomonadota bacterium]
MTSKVLYIYTKPTAGADVQARDSVLAIPGRGLQGDRYAQNPEGSTSPDQQVTLIEIENIEGVKQHGIHLHPSQTRRNIVTQGIALNELVDAEFLVGEVRLRGVRLCEPCAYLEGLTAKGLVKALVHKAGLRAQILNEGTITVGDEIRV